MATSHQAALRVRAGVQRTANKGKKGKGWKATWRDRTTPGKEKAKPEEGFLLLSAEYEDRHPRTIEQNNGKPGLEAFYTRQMHRIAMAGRNGTAYSKTTTCRRFYDGSACLACDELQRGNKKVDNGRTDPDGHVKSGFSFNCIEFGLFELQEAKDKDGNVVRRQEDHSEGKWRRGDPIMQYEKITRPKDRQEILADIDRLVADKSVVLYRKRYMDVGPNHLNVLSEVDAKAAEHCKNCGTGQLSVTGFQCASCSEMMVDVVDANMTDDERDAYGQGNQQCSACGETAMPSPIYACDNCEHADPYRWFEVVAKLRKTGEGAQTVITVDDVEPIDAFRLADDSFVIQFDKDGNPTLVDSIEGDKTSPQTFVYQEDFAKLVDNQFNFEEIHRPVSNDEIAQWLGIRNPYSGGGPSQATQGRGHAPQEESGRRGRGRPTVTADDDDDVAPEAVPRRSVRKEPVRRR